jgi:anaerobic magnesium-protoporphyrin IX monomethyl ester cyclase
MKEKVILICGDIPREITVDNIMEHARLRVDGVEASANFLAHYFQNGHSTDKASDKLAHQDAPLHLLANGVYLHQYLSNRGFDVELIHLFSTGKEHLTELLKQDHLAVVISTTFLSSTHHIDEIGSFIKKHSPGSIIIAGGIFIWKSYQSLLRCRAGEFDEETVESAKRDDYFIDEKRKTPIDLFINNQKGEYTLHKLLKRIQSGEDYTDLPNLAYYKGDRIVLNELEIEPGEFHEEKINWGSLPFNLKGVEYPVTAGTGCCMRCEFCDFINLREFYNRSVPSIVEELKTIPMENGIRKVFFINDNFLYNKKIVREMCGEFIRQKLNLRWRAFLRVDVMDEESAQLLYESGCREVLLGIESGDRGILEKMNKKTTPEKILSGMAALNKCGINTISTFVVGFPGETAESVGNTIDLINAFETSGPGLHNYSIFTFCLYPLSNVAKHDRRLKYNLTGYKDNWSHDTMDIHEAVVQAKRIIDSVKSEISPIYWEFPIIPGLTVDEQKAFYKIRNDLAKMQRGVLRNGDGSEQWAEMERLMRKVSL